MRSRLHHRPAAYTRSQDRDDGSAFAPNARVHAAELRQPVDSGLHLTFPRVGRVLRVPGSTKKLGNVLDELIARRDELLPHEDLATSGVKVQHTASQTRTFKELLRTLHDDTRGSINVEKLGKAAHIFVSNTLRWLTGIEYIGPQVMVQETINRGIRNAHLGKLGAILPQQARTKLSAEDYSVAIAKNMRLVRGTLRAIDRDRLHEHLDQETLVGRTFAREPLKFAILVFDRLLGSRQDPFNDTQMEQATRAISAGIVRKLRSGNFAAENY